MTMVYRFRTWDITNDCYQESRRWATKEAIERVRGEINSAGVEVDDKYLGVGEGAVDGMTARGFDAHRPPFSDFQGHVRR
jgi:hypothetical protein